MVVVVAVGRPVSRWVSRESEKGLGAVERVREGEI
jgi:hypothetical protein